MVTRNDLVTALKDVKYNKREMLNVIKTFNDEIDVLISAKDQEGQPLFKAIEIDDVLHHCYRMQSFKAETLSEMLENPQVVERITQGGNRAYEFGQLLGYVAHDYSGGTSLGPMSFGDCSRNY